MVLEALSSRVGLMLTCEGHVSRTLNRSLLIQYLEHGIVLEMRYITQTNVQCLPRTAILVVCYPHYQHSLSTVYCCVYGLHSVGIASMLLHWVEPWALELSCS